MFSLSYCFSTGTMTAGMALWHNACKAECYVRSYLAWRRLWFLGDGHSDWISSVTSVLWSWRILHTIWRKLQRRIFIINYISLLYFCSVIIFWRCEASWHTCGIKEVLCVVFSGFSCVSAQWQSFIFYGNMSCSVPLACLKPPSHITSVYDT